MKSEIYPRVKEFLTEHEDATLEEIAEMCNCSPTWAVTLRQRYFQEKAYQEHPERVLLEVYKEGYAAGKEDGTAEGLIVAGLGVSLLEATGLSPVELLTHLKEQVQNGFKSIEAS